MHLLLCSQKVNQKSTNVFSDPVIKVSKSFLRFVSFRLISKGFTALRRLIVPMSFDSALLHFCVKFHGNDEYIFLQGTPWGYCYANYNVHISVVVCKQMNILCLEESWWYISKHTSTCLKLRYLDNSEKIIVHIYICIVV